MNIKQLLTATILLLPSGAYGQSEFDEAKFLAEQGDAEAQLNLGIRYANGEGVPEDDAEAVKLYRLAAKQGDAEAQNNLGIMYANGDGVPQNRGQTTFKRLGLPELRLLKKNRGLSPFTPFTLGPICRRLSQTARLNRSVILQLHRLSSCRCGLFAKSIPLLCLYQ